MANVKQLIKDIFSLEEQIAGLTSLLNRSKAAVQSYFDEHKIPELEVEFERGKTSVTLVAKKTERAYIDYHADKLKESLDKEIFNEIVVKTYVINNMEGLISLLKNAGIKPAEFKHFINTTEIVNKEKIKQLYAIGDITLESLKGCYTSKIVKSIQIKEKKG